MPVKADATVEEAFEYLKQKVGKLVPEAELRYKAELVQQINQLKKERGALILGHNYMEPALFHSVCDEVGDSLELSRTAARTDADPIIFCGVRFMAETAKILNPDKTVLLPAERAGCSLAESITAEDVRELKRRFPGVPVVTYINTYADVKAESDICCTSSNAARVVNALNTDTIIFIPDEYLAKNVAAETGKKIITVSKQSVRDDSADFGSDYAMIGWEGRCEVHEKFTVEDIKNTREQFPGTVVLAHPECSPEVVAAADYADSTSRMVKYVQETEAKHFLILTECAMGDNIIAENPEKDILRLCSVRCPHMNEITLEDTLKALKENVQIIELEEELRLKALTSVERMLEL